MKLAAVVLAVPLLACRGADGPISPSAFAPYWLARARGASSRTGDRHGLELGQRLSKVIIDCPSGRLVLAGASDTQLITLATLRDCSACEAHMIGLDELKRQGRLPPDEYLVVWPQPGTSAHELEGYTRQTARRVCVDSAGHFWDRFNVQHTPVTLVVKDGRIVYLDDRPLLSGPSIAAFLTGIGHFW